MSESGSRLLWLHDSRLAPLATSGLPAWLWSADATHVLFANPTGAAIFGAAAPAALAARRFDLGQPAAAQFARLATTLVPGAPARLERLRGFGAGVGRALTCQCSLIAITDGAAGILVAATERAGPDLPLGERVQRLLADSDEPIAVFAPSGALLHATAAGRARLGAATTLASVAPDTLMTEALANGRAAGESKAGSLLIARIGTDAAMVLVMSFGASTAADAVTPELTLSPATVPDTAPTPERGPKPEARNPTPTAPQPETATPGEIAPLVPESDRAPSSPPPAPASGRGVAAPRRHPLRFVWQIDDAGGFTIGSDEFVELIGAGMAAMLGRPWQEIAATLALDGDGQISRAIESHDTWSGLSAHWPVDGSAERLAVELSGLPVFDRERHYRGYRGFGVCRDLPRLADIARQRQAEAATAAATIAAAAAAAGAGSEAEQQPGTTEPARNGRTVQPTEPSDEGSASGETALVQNVVPFPAAPPTPTLSPTERRAFRELSRRLTERLTAAGVSDIPAAADPTLTDLAEAAKAASEPLSAPPHIPTNGPAFEALDEEAPVQQARPVLDRFPLGVLVYQLNDLLYANPAFLRWCGFDSVEALAEAGGLDSFLLEGSIVGFEHGSDKTFAITSPGGDTRSAEARLFLVPWEGDSAFALLTTPTAEPRPEANTLAAAQAETNELNAILDTATDGVIVLDREGRVMSANRSAQTLFGYDAAQFAGRVFAELFAPESADTARDYLDGLQHNGVASVLNDGREMIGRERQGGLIPLFVTMGRVGDGGEKFCAVFRDITQWKKAEEDLIEAKRQAEKQSSAKSDFLAKISHEIRTPLNAIIGFSEVMMEERFGAIGNDRYRQYLKDIHTSGGHLISLINDLLDLSKIEAGKLELSFTGVALNDLTQQCVALMQPQANRERIIIRTSLVPKLPQVVADARSVRQIVLNLLSNSIKFTGAGGQVIVSTALTDAGEVVLRVRDTGVGMSEKDLVTALEPFRQLATSTRFGSGGTGLGLPLTKALAEANRAAFHIKSSPNAGTLVEITFPSTRVLAE